MTSPDALPDLRTAVEGLPGEVGHFDGGSDFETHLIQRAAVLALIPKGAVLVTEEGLAAALDGLQPYRDDSPQTLAAAILAILRDEP